MVEIKYKTSLFIYKNVMYKFFYYIINSFHICNYVYVLQSPVYVRMFYTRISLRSAHI